MTTITHTAAQVKSTTQAIFFAALLGLSVVSFVGVLHAQTIHDAAHDLRHASGFPCH
jgi:cobalt transporter subunit CbtB